MNANLDKIAQDLYGKIQTRFSNIQIGDENAKVLSKKEEIPQARFFEFEYEENGEALGTIAITLDAQDGIVVQVSGDLVNDEDNTTHANAYKFIRSFRQFAKDRLLNFDVQNIGKSNLDKRDYEFQAKRKEEPVMAQQPVMENKLYGNFRMSYQDLGEARLVIKHSQPVNIDLPAGRTMHIESIYIENAQGERFKYPFKHLNGARALAEHIKHGGNPYDAIGSHICSLSEELASLRKFKGYVSRQEQLSEAMQGVTTRVMERIEEIKDTITKLQRPNFYEAFAESFEAQDDVVVPEDIQNDLINRLTIRTFNEELKSVFPYIYKFVDESELPVVELGANDLLGDDLNNESVEHNYEVERESIEDQYESFLEEIVREDKDELFSPNKDAQNRAIEKFNNEIISQELQNGPQAANAVGSLKGFIDDPQFLLSLRDIDADLDIRPLIQNYILDKDPAVAARLNFGGEEGNTPAPEAAPAAEPATPAPAPAPAAEAPPVEEPAPAPVAEGKKNDDEDSPPWDVDPKDKKSKPTTPGKYGQGYSQARHLARQGLEQALKKAVKSGATLETQMDFGNKVMTIAEVLDECGIAPQQIGFVDKTEDGLQGMLKYISGFYNKEKGNFPLGGMRVKIKVKKAFEDGMFGGASVDELKKVIQFIDAKDPSGNEHNQIMRLAGVNNSEQEVDEAGQGVNDISNLENMLKGLSLRFGDEEVNLANPDQQQMARIGNNVMQGVAGQVEKNVPNQNIQFPGGQMNPADMMKAIMQKIKFGD